MRRGFLRFSGQALQALSLQEVGEGRGGSAGLPPAGIRRGIRNGAGLLRATEGSLAQATPRGLICVGTSGRARVRPHSAVSPKVSLGFAQGGGVSPACMLRLKRNRVLRCPIHASLGVWPGSHPFVHSCQGQPIPQPCEAETGWRRAGGMPGSSRRGAPAHSPSAAPAGRRSAPRPRPDTRRGPPAGAAPAASARNTLLRRRKSAPGPAPP